MKIELRREDSWFHEKIISNKRAILGLLYYFIGHLYLTPLGISKIILYFKLMSRDDLEIYLQMFSDSLSAFVLIFILWPIIIDNLERFSRHIDHTILSGIKLYVPTILVNAVLTMAIFYFTGISESTNQEAVLLLASKDIWAIAIPAVLVAPLIEELIFRGIIFRSLRINGFALASIVSGFCFGLLHCIGDIVSGNWQGLIYIIVYMSMGIFMCKAYEDSENLFGAVSLHLFNNFISVIAILSL